AERPLELALLRPGERLAPGARAQILGVRAVLVHAPPRSVSSSSPSTLMRSRSLERAVRRRLRTVLIGAHVDCAVSSIVYPSTACSASTSACVSRRTAHQMRN